VAGHATGMKAQWQELLCNPWLSGGIHDEFDLALAAFTDFDQDPAITDSPNSHAPPCLTEELPSMLESVRLQQRRATDDNFNKCQVSSDRESGMHRALYRHL